MGGDGKCTALPLGGSGIAIGKGRMPVHVAASSISSGSGLDLETRAVEAEETAGEEK